MVGSTLVMLTTTSPRSIVTVAVAVRVPEVAVMVAELSDTAATKPSPETVAIVESDEDQVTVTSARVLPPASSPVAVSVSVSPMTLKVSESLESASVAATWATVAVAVPLADPEVAVIVAEPFETAVTRPADETVATDADDVDHDTLAPLIVAPFWSLTVADSGEVSPRDAKLRLVTESVTEVATGVGGVGGVGGVVGELPLSPHAASSNTAARVRIL